GWRKIHDASFLKGTVAIEVREQQYLMACDNGSIKVSAPHEKGESPSEQEQFVVLPVEESIIALKTGYEKYIGLNSKMQMIAISDAVGVKERFEPVFQG
ncbi:MAG: Protein frg1, partial [Paramarteilia canceri]